MSDRSCAAAADSDAVADDNAAADAGVLTASPGDSRPCWATLSCFLLRRTSLVRGGRGWRERCQLINMAYVSELTRT